MLTNRHRRFARTTKTAYGVYKYNPMKNTYYKLKSSCQQSLVMIYFFVSYTNFYSATAHIIRVIILYSCTLTYWKLMQYLYLHFQGQ